jgi:hypothetical protein
MKKRTPLLVVAALSSVSLLPAQGKPDAKDDRVLEELRRLQEKVEALERRVQELEKQLAEQPEKVTRPSPLLSPPLTRRSADVAALRKIRLPEDPSREEIEEYVDAILAASRGQNSFSTEDLQIPMLVKVGRKNVDVLIDRLDGAVEFYLTAAVSRLAGEEHKELILKVLPAEERLIGVVVEKGWVQDARSILTAALKNAPSYLPPQWIDAVASLRDPETHGDLRRYFVHGSNKSLTYQAIRNLPGIDLDAAVTEAWKKPETAISPFERSDLAPIAAAHGHRDALDLAFELLDGSNDWRAREARKTILRHTGATGSDDELKAWFRDNKDQLQWDAEMRKFVIRKTV